MNKLLNVLLGGIPGRFRGRRKAFPAGERHLAEDAGNGPDAQADRQSEGRGMPLHRRVFLWLEDRTGVFEKVGRLAKHPVPPGTGWKYVFGSATLLAFVVQVITGIALTMLFVPSAEGAYDSLQYITNEAFLGRLIRGMHYFGASAMVILVTIHMLRVFLTGSFKFPREVNWLSGAVLLLFTVLMAFTGQVLRWDQNAIWSVVVGAEQAGRIPLIGRPLAHLLLGGDTLGAGTLSHLFSMHVMIVPGLILGVVTFHLYLVLRNGISEPPRPGRPVDPETYRRQYRALLRRRGVPFWPDAAWRDVVFAALVVTVVVTLAVVVGPYPLSRPPNPSIVRADPKPDWYLIWYFSVLALLPHDAENIFMVVLPLSIVGTLFLIPFLSNRGERHVWRRPWTAAAVVTTFTAITWLTIVGYREPWLPRLDTPPLPPSVVASSDSTVVRGARLFHDQGCQYCHRIAGYGGIRGPNLSTIGERRTPDQLTLRIMNGGYNMPAFAGVLTEEEVRTIVAFLTSRQSVAGTMPRSTAPTASPGADR